MEQLLKSLPFSEHVQTLIGVVIICLVTVIAVYLSRVILFVVGARLAAKTRTDLDDKLLETGRKYLHILVYLIGFHFLMNFIQKSIWGGYVGEMFFTVIDGILYSLGVFVVAQLAVQELSILIRWFGENIAVKTDARINEEFVPLFDRAIKVTLYVLAVLVVLDYFDVNIAGLITVLGVGSLAVALAAQETIANMIGGFVIMIDRPFRAGDRVRLDDGTVCVVYQIGVRSTKFQTFENTLIIVPNAELMKSTVHNLTYPKPEIRVRVDVGVSYDSDLSKVREIMIAEAKKHPNVLKEYQPEFRLLNFGDSSLDVSLRCRVADVSLQFTTTCDLREQVLDAFRREGIEIPFPQRVITMISEEQGKEKPEYVPVPDDKKPHISPPPSGHRMLGDVEHSDSDDDDGE